MYTALFLFFLRRAFKMQCTEDGRWLEGSCEPVMCPPPPPVFYGMYHCTDGFLFDSMCWLQCQSVNSTAKGSAPCKQVCHFLFVLFTEQVPMLSDKSWFFKSSVDLTILIVTNEFRANSISQWPCSPLSHSMQRSQWVMGCRNKAVSPQSFP